MGFFLNYGACTLFPDNNKFGFLKLIHVVPVLILTLQLTYTACIALITSNSKQ